MRGKQAKSREVKPDKVYQSQLVNRLINKVMLHGKKTVAEKIVYTSLENLSKELKTSPVEFLERAIKNVTPDVEVRSRRIGGANYQIPTPVSERRQVSLAIRWVVDAARAKKGTSIVTSLSEELRNAYNNTGGAAKKKEEVRRMAEANKAFAYFAMR